MSTLVVEAIENSSAENRFQPNPATAQATTSGTAFDFTGIPSWVSEIKVVLEEVSLSGTDSILIQIGDSGGLETSSYLSTGGYFSSAGQSDLDSTAGYIIQVDTAAGACSGVMTLLNIDGNTWVASHGGKSTADRVLSGGGSKDLSDTLTQLRITRTGTDTFDAGKVNIIYE